MKAPPRLYPASRDGKSGYIDATGELVIPLRFDRAARFADGLAAVAVEESRFFIDEAAEVAFSFPPVAEYVLPFSEAKALFCLHPSHGEGFGFLDRKGRVAIPAVYLNADYFSGGLAVVMVSGNNAEGKHGLIGHGGNMIVEPAYDCILGFAEHDDLTVFRLDGKYGVMDKAGHHVIESILPGAKNVQEGIMGAQDANGKWGLLEPQRGFVVEPRFAEIVSNCHEGKIGVRNSEWMAGFIDKEGRQVNGFE